MYGGCFVTSRSVGVLKPPRSAGFFVTTKRPSSLNVRVFASQPTPRLWNELSVKLFPRWHWLQRALLKNRSCPCLTWSDTACWSRLTRHRSHGEFPLILVRS